MNRRDEFHDADRVIQAFEVAKRRAEREGTRHALARPVEDHLGDWGVTCACGFTALGMTERQATLRGLSHIKGAAE